MTEAHDLYRTIGQQHLRLGQSYQALADHLDHLRDNPSPPPESEPVASEYEAASNEPTMPCAHPDQWPQIGESVEFGFVDRGDGLILRAVVEVPCHPKTSESAEIDFLRLHPLREGVQRTFADWPSPPAEMAVHAPLTIADGPIALNTPSAIIDTKTDVVSPIVWANESGVLEKPVNVTAGQSLFVVQEEGRVGIAVGSSDMPVSEIRPAQPQPSEPSAIEQPDPPSRRRSRTDYTASEWAHSPHFLKYMKNPPFNTWTAEQQNAKRDAFAATFKDAPPMNRWGKRFESFCGV